MAMSACEELRLGLSPLNDGTDRRRVPLQDEDHPGNDPHLVPGFPRLCSGRISYSLWQNNKSTWAKHLLYL